MAFLVGLISAVTVSAQTIVGDPTFGNNGLVIVPFIGSSPDQLLRVVRPFPDGSLVSVSTRTDLTPRQLVVRKYLPNGVLDQGFGDQGEAMLVISGPAEPMVVHSAQVRPDGRILVLADVNWSNVLVQFLPNGDLDPAFGNQGVMQHVGSGLFSASKLYLDDEGRALVLGSYGSIASVTRYLPDGTLDTTWGQAGIAQVMPPLFPTVATAMVAIQQGGYIVVGDRGGWISTAAWLTRLDANGASDLTFGNGGHTMIDRIPDELGSYREMINDVTILQDGRIAAVGRSSIASTSTSPVVLVYQPNGQLDPAFGEEGLFPIALPVGQNFLGAEVFARNDGRLLVTAVRTGPSIPDNVLFFLELLPDGTPNEGYGASGIRTYARPSTSFNDHGGMNFLANGDILTNVALFQQGQHRQGILRLRSLELTTGTEPLTDTEQGPLMAWPNPTSGELAVGITGMRGAVDLRLFDARGAEVQYTQVSVDGPYIAVQLRLREDLPSGTYLLLAQDDRVVHHARITVVR